ncbi:MAG: hypothetical protein U1F87_04900 [Kiritimatiellia bacterium]
MSRQSGPSEEQGLPTEEILNIQRLSRRVPPLKTSDIIANINAVSSGDKKIDYLDFLKQQLSDDLIVGGGIGSACRAEDPCRVETCLSEFCYVRTCLSEFCYVRTCSSEFCKILDGFPIPCPRPDKK